ncbi:MBL fold metallo-hydrolase [Paracoccus lutimaris]|uniref:L-ascorbate metabolism protein UlaG (Beta-lactamase superfamily) n=1 Tax=Paracoccus lutimaris TaxID=1490030 RepID=A0A368Z9U6_9RHOB|nr:MBL fold metallo-hydrolase [Paracoccus lutimaris]RCW87234.1 L-ascorbate metabolism protein UlaG (beta-lactamase superfamily) [Paracoccus lutimaris]
MRLTETPLPAPLAQILAQPPGGALRLFWLGQAGFVIEGGGRRAVIDPYLSDSLAQKYRGTRFAHLRMMPAPVAPGAIRHVDLVLATHAHTDHLDPGTLPALLAANAGAALIAPRAALATALERSGIARQRLRGIDAGEVLDCGGITVTATRAAHEDLARDEAGHHRFLGLMLTMGGARVFHSGDTIPFAGQIDEVRALRADLALLPVNGRDATRAGNGVPGNLDMAEALDLARAAAIPAMIAHHFDLFDFNTAPRPRIEAMARASRAPHALAARADMSYGLASQATGQIP